MCQVLIVEDNPTLRSILKGILTARFPMVAVEVAANAEEALSEFNKTNPLLIFMDIRLPDESGLEIARRIKEINPQIKIVILTSFDNPEYREAAFRNGASFFLSKGDVRIDDIASLVSSTLKVDENCGHSMSDFRRNGAGKIQRTGAVD